MNQNPEQQDNTPEESSEETLAERSARLEAEAMNLSPSEEDDPLAPEPQQELYGEEDPLNAPEGNVEILAMQNELAEAKDKMVRAVAEAENTRRRAQKEREDARKFAISGFAKDLLSVSDNLRRALDAIPDELKNENEQIKSLVEGIEATERELLRAYEKNGITAIDTTNSVFDPNIHEVMFETPGTGQPGGTIIQTLEMGYMLNKRLLRPARVGIAKDDGSGEPPPETPHIDTEA